MENKIIILADILSHDTYKFFKSPSINNVLTYDPITLRYLQMWSYLRKYYDVEIMFKSIECDAKEFNDKLWNPMFISSKVNAIIIVNMFDGSVYRDLLLTDCKYILDCGVGQNINEAMDITKKAIYDLNTILFPDVLKKASLITYTHPYQRLIYLWELAKLSTTKSMPNKKLCYVGQGVSGTLYKTSTYGSNVMFVDPTNRISNVGIVQKATEQFGMKFTSDIANDVVSDSIFVSLYNYKTSDSLVTYPARTLELASMGFRAIVDESVFKILNKYKGFLFSCNSSNIGRVIKTLEYVTETPMNREALKEFNYRFSWGNQLQGLVDKITDINRE